MSGLEGEMQQALETRALGQAAALLRRGADINSTDTYDNTLLMLAVDAGDETLAKELVRRGADVNRANQGGKTALSLAVNANNDVLVLLLLKAGAKMDVETYKLDVLKERNRIRYLRPFIEAGMDIDTRDNFNNTALTIAVISNEPELMEWLLDRGADIEAKNNNQNTPLAMAALNGRPALMKQLMARGAELYRTFGVQQRLWQAGNKDNKEEVTQLLVHEAERRRSVAAAAAAWNSETARTARKIAALRNKALRPKPPQ